MRRKTTTIMTKICDMVTSLLWSPLSVVSPPRTFPALVAVLEFSTASIWFEGDTSPLTRRTVFVQTWVIWVVYWLIRGMSSNHSSHGAKEVTTTCANEYTCRSREFLGSTVHDAIQGSLYLKWCSEGLLLFNSAVYSPVKHHERAEWDEHHDWGTSEG